jgi:hypothetical protein
MTLASKSFAETTLRAKAFVMKTLAAHCLRKSFELRNLLPEYGGGQPPLKSYG